MQSHVHATLSNVQAQHKINAVGAFRVAFGQQRTSLVVRPQTSSGCFLD